MKIGFLGFGEAAAAIAAGLFEEEGVRGAKAYDILLTDESKREKLLATIQKSGAEAAHTVEEVVRGMDIVISAVPANFAVAAAESAEPYLEGGQLFVDVSPATPAEKLKMAEMTAAKGAKFVDGAMLGSLWLYRHKVPMLLSGEGSAELKQMLEPYHMDMTIVEGPAGAATSIKLIRSISAKGVACVLFETLQAAQYFHVEEMVVDSLVESFGPEFIKVIDGWVAGTCIHATRRAHEVQNSEAMLREAGLPCQMTTTTKEKLAYIAQLDIPSRFADGVPRDWHKLLAGWGLVEQEAPMH